MKNRHFNTKILYKTILKNICIIIITSLVFCLGGLLYAKHERHVVYESTRSMMIAHTYHGVSANEQVQADISLGKTYSKIIESENVAKLAYKKLPKSIRKKYNSSRIRSLVSASNVDQTTIIRVRVKTGSAKESVRIVNAVTDAAVKVIPQKVPSPGKITLFSKATVSETTTNTTPSMKKCGLLGLAIGFLLGMLISFSITTWSELI